MRNSGLLQKVLMKTYSEFTKDLIEYSSSDDFTVKLRQVFDPETGTKRPRWVKIKKRVNNPNAPQTRAEELTPGRKKLQKLLGPSLKRIVDKSKKVTDAITKPEEKK